MNDNEIKRVLKGNNWTETSPGEHIYFRAQKLDQHTFIETIDLNSKTLTIQSMMNEHSSMNLIGGILKQNSTSIGQYFASHTFGTVAKLTTGYQAMKATRALGELMETATNKGRTKLTKRFDEPPINYIQQDSRKIAERYYSLLKAIEKII